MTKVRRNVQIFGFLPNDSAGDGLTHHGANHMVDFTLCPGRDSNPHASRQGILSHTADSGDDGRYRRCTGETATAAGTIRGDDGAMSGAGMSRFMSGANPSLGTTPAPVARFPKFRTEQARARRRQHAAVGQ